MDPTGPAPLASSSFSPPPPPPPLPSIAELLFKAAPGGPKAALGADGDPAAALALAVHALFVEAGFRPVRGPALAPAAASPSASFDDGGGSGWGAGKAARRAPSSSSSSAPSSYAPPPGWRARPGAPDEWLLRYTCRGKAPAAFVVHLSLQRATGRMLVRASEEEDSPGSAPPSAGYGGGNGGGGGGNGGGGGGGGGGGARVSPSLPMAPLVYPAGGGAAVGPPPSRNQRLLGLQLENYVAAGRAELAACDDWSTAGVLAPRADAALRGMVREHLTGPLLAGAEDAPAYEDEEGGEGAGGGGAWRDGGGGGAAARGGRAWRADRVVGALAVGVGVAAIAVGVAYAIGPQRRRAVRDSLQQWRRK